MDDSSTFNPSDGRRRIALIWRGDPRAPLSPTRYAERLAPVAAALVAAGFDVDPFAWFDDAADAALERLFGCDGALAWINPLSDGADRRSVDRVLRSAAMRGVWIGAHPDVIDLIGVKDVLYRTQSLGWGTDVDLYSDLSTLALRLPPKLASGPRVLKPLRGNDGQGVVKVDADGQGGRLKVQWAADNSEERTTLENLLSRLAPVFARFGGMVDQAFMAGVSEGMVRCYMCQGRVIGFAEQDPRDTGAGAGRPFAMNSAKTMHPADAEQFVPLRRRMEDDWTPGLRRLLGISPDRLPILWDADFIRRPGSRGAEDLALCEINASCVSPFPPGAPNAIAQAIRARFPLTGWQISRS